MLSGMERKFSLPLGRTGIQIRAISSLAAQETGLDDRGGQT